MGRTLGAAGILYEATTMSRQPQGRGTSQEWDATSWLVGCALGAVATTGIVILVFLVALVVQPPVWVQIALGGGLALGGAVFAWLIASAWRTRTREEKGSEPTDT
jgi:hypothetical protein